MAILVNQYNRTRIAPTPSGYLHLGNILSFCITAALAKESGAKILLRIDDLDQQRVNKEYLEDIFDTLNFLQIPWDEGPRNVSEFQADYSQVHRMPLYQAAIKQLYKNGQVFACTCTRRQLTGGSNDCTCFKKHIPLTEANTNWRLITDHSDILKMKNHNGQVIQTVLPADMRNFVVKRKDGLPAYQLASVVDDLFYEVDLVIRGEDLWPSTLAQQALATALGSDNFHNITFYHHPLLKEISGKKLSKSAGSTSVRYLRENGKTPADIYTLITAMLGINKTINNWQQLSEITDNLITKKAGN